MKANPFTIVRCVFASLVGAQILFQPPTFGCLLCQALDDPFGPRYRGEAISAPSSTNAVSVTSIAASKANSSAIADLQANVPTPATNATPEFITSGGTKYLSVSFAQLASFLIAAPSDTAVAESDSTANTPRVLEQVPERIKSLNDKSVALTGFILPVHTESGLTSDFLLLRNQSACCYGVMPKLNEWVVVRSAGKGVKAIMDIPVTVVGTFHVREHRENGVLTAIYQLDCDQLITSKQ